MVSVLLAGCDGPTLWIGDALSDASVREPTPDAARAIPPDSVDASQAPPSRPAVQPETPAVDPRVTTGAESPAEPHTPREDPRSSDDAGVEPKTSEPVTHPTETPVLRPINLPSAQTPCPTIGGHGTYRFGNPNGRNLMVEVYAPQTRNTMGPGGPLILYWHAIGTNSTEVVSGFGQDAIDAVVAQGGVVAAFNAKLCLSCGVGDDVQWYAEDDAVADHVVACALEQANIDTRHIHSLGFSAGALYSIRLALVRSNYIASVVSYSGGAYGDDKALDPDNKVASIVSYGRQGLDTIVLDFTDASLQWYDESRARGAYSMLCPHDGGHIIPTDLVPQIYQFFMDHPYEVAPEPYRNAIPSGFPEYCSNTKPPESD